MPKCLPTPEAIIRQIHQLYAEVHHPRDIAHKVGVQQVANRPLEALEDYGEAAMEALERAKRGRQLRRPRKEASAKGPRLK
jgi:NADH:ubiquinone oxidoreductase subunit B-like Fe-S oxidoreductase